jgi:predicted oxidoreductase (fatty acid repression mutant protein)
MKTIKKASEASKFNAELYKLPKKDTKKSIQESKGLINVARASKELRTSVTKQLKEETFKRIVQSRRRIVLTKEEKGKLWDILLDQ